VISSREIDELLQKAIAGGGGEPRAAPADLEAMKAQLADLQGGMTEGMGTELPQGTKVVYAEPEPEVSAPPPSRVPNVPRTVDVPTSAQPGGPDVDGLLAKAQDDLARRQMAMERGGRELVAGLTRTQALPVTPRPTNAFEQWAQQQRQNKQDSLRATEASNNAARTDAYLRTSAAAGPRAERGLDIKEAELKSREEMAKAKAAEEAAKFEETKRHHKASEGIGWTAAKRADEKAGRDEERLGIKRDALKPRQGWEPIDPSGPTFRDPAQAKSFDDSVAAMGAIRNHRDHVMHELESLKKAKTPAEADIAVGRLNAQMGALASKLRAAEGLNNTDAANHAIETMLSLQNGSAVNWKNVLNEGRLPAILNAAIASGEANLDTIAESNNLRRTKGSGAVAQSGPAGGPQRVTATNPKTGEKLEWNGKEWVSAR
jgi:hypothetical protein